MYIYMHELHVHVYACTWHLRGSRHVMLIVLRWSQVSAHFVVGCAEIIMPSLVSYIHVHVHVSAVGVD